MVHNGPAVFYVCEPRPLGGAGVVFAVMIQFYCVRRDRGTILTGAAGLSPVTNLVAGSGAMSQYKLSKSQKFFMVQDFFCVQMRASTAVASAKAGVRVQELLAICHGCRNKR